ncbi:MAG: methyltransferase domain-containing protein [Planctomycetes bacterium]|nr:methyltransferase domain-containing protein [Planctomycetota bacterium]
MGEWFTRFFDGLYARVLADTAGDPRASDEARMVKKLLRLRKGQSVLDVPCGKGRLTLPLARMGLTVTGVDFTAAYLRRARRAARQEGLDIRLVESDMRNIAFDAEFDAAFNWFGSFGYFSDADNLAFCQRILRALRPGGRFLIEGINKSWLLTHFREHDESLHGPIRIAVTNRWDAATNRVHSTWVFTDGRSLERHTIVMRIFNGGELRSLLSEAGFRDVRLYPRPPVGPFTRHSRRLIAVARRPAT